MQSDSDLGKFDVNFHGYSYWFSLHRPPYRLLWLFLHVIVAGEEAKSPFDIVVYADGRYRTFAQLKGGILKHTGFYWFNGILYLFTTTLISLSLRLRSGDAVDFFYWFGVGAAALDDDPIHPSWWLVGLQRHSPVICEARHTPIYFGFLHRSWSAIGFRIIFMCVPLSVRLNLQ